MRASTLFVWPLFHFVCRRIDTICKQGTAHAKFPSLDRRARELCEEDRLNEPVLMLHDIHNNVHSSTYVYLLQCCIQKNALDHGKRIHSLVLRQNERRFRENIFLQKTFVQMYVKCGSLADGRSVFDEMLERDVVSWNVMIAAYRRHGFSEEALVLFHQMQPNGIQPNEFTFANVVPACTSSASWEEGVGIHGKIIRSGFQNDFFVGNALIDMYAKLGNMHKARLLFDKMEHRDTISWNAMIGGYAQNGLLDKALELFTAIPQRNAISWNAMIAGYVQNGLNEEALNVFENMQLSGVQPNEFVFASVVPAYASSASLAEGVDIHRKIVRCGFHSDVVVINALIDMYAKFGNMHKAHVLFDKVKNRNMISWTAMIRGYAQNGLLDYAEKLFKELHHKDSISWNAMIAGYAQNGFLEKATELFEKMPERDTISWTAMISGYAQNGHGLEALQLFQNMQLTASRPNLVTFASILPACATFAAMERGVEIHGKIIRSGFISDLIVINALIDMYAKCGSIQKAHVLFDKMHYRDTTSWTAMIAGYAMHGYGKEAIKLFEEMEQSGTSPDHITLISVLSACSHAGLVKEGYQYFNSMNEYYHITPSMEHYVCMVDLLGRAGLLDEAKHFINNMPMKPDTVVWTCLLGACTKHNNLELAEFVAEHLLEMDPQNAVPYVLLSNIYAKSRKWNEIENVRKIMKDRRIGKIPGCSWIEVDK